jgi:glutamate decarboxylase
MTLEKNAIDKSEYPRTAEIEKRWVNMIADLWNAGAGEKYTGTSTIGSSEACMLGGMAMKFLWREKAKKANIDIAIKKPNLVISSGYQVCWEKFCVYFDIELREVPINNTHLSLDLDKVLDYVDEYTIGVVGILGITYTGKYDDIKGLNDLLTEYNRKATIDVPIHVDAASGGLYTPFMEPELLWDFRLENVVSINVSGHKYGLVYPGVGWVLWKDKKYLPKELVFNVSYLGGEMPTMAINFSHSASHLIGQYYNFIRYGKEGYRSVHRNTRKVAMFLAKMIEDTGYFHIYNDGSQLPIVCYALKETARINWSLYDLSDRMQMKGWQIPTYPLPPKLENIIIQRLVCRADLGYNMAQEMAEDFRSAITELNNAKVFQKESSGNRVQGFTH